MSHNSSPDALERFIMRLTAQYIVTDHHVFACYNSACLRALHAFSRVPTVYQVFSWAEKEEGPIEERLEAVGEALVTLDRDGATSRRSTQQCGVSS